MGADCPSGCPGMALAGRARAALEVIPTRHINIFAVSVSMLASNVGVARVHHVARAIRAQRARCRPKAANADRTRRAPASPPA